jgi:hypothetical protein
MKAIKLFSIILFSALMSLSSFVQAAQSGNNKQTRTVSEFHGISVSTGVDLYLTQKSIQEVRVEADEDDLKNLVTEVEGGILKIYMKSQSWFNLNWKNQSIKVYVSFKTLDKLQASSGSDIASESVLNLEKLDLDASSGSDVKLELNASEVKAEASGGSDISMKGKAGSFEVSASSGSDIIAGDFQTKKCNASVSSGSDMKINVTEELKAHASSGGDISYSGNPAKKEVKESSGGSVHSK